MEIREITEKNILNQFANSLLEKWEWGEFKEKFGWQAKRLEVFENEKPIFALQILIKKLPLGFSFFYCPIRLPEKKILKALLGKIKEVAKDEKSLFCQMDILDETSPQKEKELKDLGFIKSFEEIQPKHTLVLDLIKTEEEILKQMKPKGRYNIKVAQKHGVTVKELKTLKDFEDYRKIHEETVKRDKISTRSFEYLKNLFSVLKDNKLGTAFIAYYKNKPIAGIIVSLAGEKSTYMYGASLYESRNVMASYLVQWEAIKWAKEKGASSYDFFGIAPTDDPKHKWAGITRFKKQFGGKQVEILGSYDLVFKPFLYNLFKIAMKIRKLK